MRKWIGCAALVCVAMATYTLAASTPSVGFGPRSIAWGHTIDEYVPVDDLVRCAQAIALAAVRFCGTT